MKKNKKNKIEDFFFLVFGIGIFLFSIVVFWISSMQLPDFKSFDERKIARSTKIYDRTGEIVLYDIHQDIKRTVVPYEDISTHVKNATVAIEDSAFYQHRGIRIKAIIRAIVTNLNNGNLLGGQGGSTITQQVVKTTLLTNEKTVTRKIKEWVLSVRLEKVLSKEEILSIYLNEVPYGGNVYGVEEASRAFFSKSSSDINLTEAAYLAAVIQAPTYFSPYGKNKEQLEERKNVVLNRMKELSFITEEEYLEAMEQVVEFKRESPLGIKAPHFSLEVKEYLEYTYGKDRVSDGGLNVITTLDYELQQKAESIVKTFAEENEEKYNASNAGLVAIDPKTGGVLVMVGSRDYFDQEIDGKYNIAFAKRQPGSSFKPFVYATAFNEGYTDDTILFDVPTEFNASCDVRGVAQGDYDQENCYMPSDFDDKFRGPMNLRDALAQSINIPAVKLLYLVGVNDSIKTAREMGITTLSEENRYGLSLVLGGGEVMLADMVSAYGVFANNGVLNERKMILKVTDFQGNVLEENFEKPRNIIPKNTALLISDILSDNIARIPTFGANSNMNFGNRSVAAKTGTTNEYRDSWIIGYTPSFVAGAWIGNNDNTSMQNRPSAGSMWRAFMDEALLVIPEESFEKPIPHPEYDFLKPVFRGLWLPESYSNINNNIDNLINSIIGKDEIKTPHSILYFVDKDNIHGPIPENPEEDSQFRNWEYGVLEWWRENKFKY